MVAELSNPEFRAVLKEKGLWRQMINATEMLLGMEIPGVESEKTDALTVLEGALETLMSNFDDDLYSRYRGSGGARELNAEVGDGMVAQKDADAGDAEGQPCSPSHAQSRGGRPTPTISNAGSATGRKRR